MIDIARTRGRQNDLSASVHVERALDAYRENNHIAKRSISSVALIIRHSANGLYSKPRSGRYRSTHVPRGPTAYESLLRPSGVGWRRGRVCDVLTNVLC